MLVKHYARQAATEFFTDYTTQKLSEGIPPERIELPIDIKTVRDASVAWELSAYEKISARPDIIKSAWERCRTKTWSLSWECMNGTEAKLALINFMAAHPDFAKELGADVESLNLMAEPDPELESEDADDANGDAEGAEEDMGKAIGVLTQSENMADAADHDDFTAEAFLVDEDTTSDDSGDSESESEEVTDLADTGDFTMTNSLEASDTSANMARLCAPVEPIDDVAATMDLSAADVSEVLGDSEANEPSDDNDLDGMPLLTLAASGQPIPTDAVATAGLTEPSKVGEIVVKDEVAAEADQSPQSPPPFYPSISAHPAPMPTKKPKRRRMQIPLGDISSESPGPAKVSKVTAGSSAPGRRRKPAASEDKASEDEGEYRPDSLVALPGEVVGKSRAGRRIVQAKARAALL